MPSIKRNTVILPDFGRFAVDPDPADADIRSLSDEARVDRGSVSQAMRCFAPLPVNAGFGKPAPLGILQGSRTFAQEPGTEARFGGFANSAAVPVVND